MLTNIVSQTSQGAGSLYLRVSSANALAPLDPSSLLTGRHYQQTRSYRCSSWSSYFGSEIERHSRRQRRMVKYINAELLNRRSSLHHIPLTEDATTALRRVVGKFWQAGASLYGTRMVSYDAGPSGPDDEGNQKGRAQKTSSASSTRTSPLTGFKRSHYGPAATLGSAAGTSSGEFTIDPITNRKVFRKTHGATEPRKETPAGTYKPYRSPLFATSLSPSYNTQNDWSPIYSDGPPQPEELSKYEKVEVDPLSTAPDPSHDSSSMYQPQARDQSEEYSLNHLPPEEQAEIYDDLRKYTPSEHDEIKDTPVEAAPKYDDLHSYKPTEHDDIKYDSEPSVQEYHDLHKYRPREHDEIANSTSWPMPKYDDLGDYRPFRPYMHNEDALSDEAAAPKYEDLDKYKSHTDQVNSDIDSTKPQYEDLDKYRPHIHAEGQPEAEQGAQYEDLDKYRSDVFKEPESNEEGGPFEQYGDLDQYKSAYRYQEPDGKAPAAQDVVEESLGEFDRKKENRENLEQAMKSHIAVADAVDREVSASLQRFRQRLKEDQPSANILRGTPEKFHELLKEHGISVDPLDPASIEAIQVGVQSAAKDHFALWRMQVAKKLTKKLAKKLADSQRASKEAGIDDEQTNMKKYRDLNPENPVTIPHRYPSPTLPPDVEHTLYKILAYDPTVQNVSIAETTSTVPDQAAPLTPSEALMRLSNPTKFLPYFKALHEEGFEIVWGKGHLLVFRKVRQPTASKPRSLESTTARPVNPIDMMGRHPLPNAADFASPTGFVNYNDSLAEQGGFLPFLSPSGEWCKKPVGEQDGGVQPFRSQIDVRREEPVFSGPKVYASTRAKKTSVAKRFLVGGVWVAGISYALGVVGEYFVTGGIDGKGPTGF